MKTTVFVIDQRCANYNKCLQGWNINLEINRLEKQTEKDSESMMKLPRIKCIIYNNHIEKEYG